MWTKTETGYTSGMYSLLKTPGKRWMVYFTGQDRVSIPLADGKQFRKLDEAKQVADDHARMLREDEFARMFPNQAMREQAEESRRELEESNSDGPAEVSEVVTAPVELPVTVDPLPESIVEVRDSIPSPVPSMKAERERIETVTLPPWIEPGTSRLSVKNTLTRLLIYADIGLRTVRYRIGNGRYLRIAP